MTANAVNRGSEKEPKDIKKGWLNPIRAAQAVCKANRGFGIVRLTVVVSQNEPVLWLEPELLKIHPASLSEAAISPTLLGLLFNLSDHVDRNKSNTVE